MFPPPPHDLPSALVVLVASGLHCYRHDNRAAVFTFFIDGTHTSRDIMRTHTISSVATALLALLALAGCGEAVDSTSIKTDGVYADFTATAEGDGQTDIQARLKTGGPNSNTFLNLEGGDELAFYVDGDSYEPDERSPVGDRTYYQKRVDKDAGGTNLRIEFTREDGENAPNSTVMMPEPFEIEAPTSSDSFSRSGNDDVDIQLDNTDQETDVKVTVRGDCLDRGYSKSVSGSQQTITIPGDELESDDTEDEEPGTCTPSVTVERIMRGDVDSAYTGGRFEATHERVTSFESTP
jgi:hypothetical protein